MKTLALLVVLALHTTGLWPHLSDPTRHRLIQASADAVGIQPPPAAPQLAQVGSLPIQTGAEPLNFDSTSAYAVDTATSTTLFAQNAASHRPIASITKLMTALVVLAGHDPEQMVTIPALPNYGPEDERIGLVPGETYRLSDLIQAALIQSANDAADALARWDAGSQAKFAAKMNAKLTEWGIPDARFSNPTGLQDTDNYASATSLAKIAQLALVNPLIRQTVASPNATITSTAGRVINLETTNQLLASGNYYGIKTGYTLAAGECFVGLTRINGHDVITVVLGAGDRFAATQTLTNWIQRNWQWL